MFGATEKKADSSVMFGTGTESHTFVLSENSVVNGNVTTSEPAKIDGTVEGSVTVENALLLGAKGVIRGPIYAQTATIEGSVTGDIICKGPVYLVVTAKVTGDIQCTSLSIVEGAYFCGKVVCSQPE